MCLFESVRVSVRKGQVPTLLFARPLLLEILLRHHVQVGVCRQLCVRWRFLSRLLPDRIGSAADLRSATNDVTIYLSRPSPDVVGTIHGAEVLLLISHLCPLGPRLFDLFQERILSSMERRLTAILAADVVGYSRLMGRDEAGTLAQLKEVRREIVEGKISRYQGRIVKLTGDGILAEFPSVVSAVACAVGLQRAMQTRTASMPDDRSIQFRVGVNLGDVIVEGDDIYGDGVNVAARLESVAAPGGIAVSQSVRDQVGNRLDLIFEDRGEQQLKNIEKPIRVYHVLLEEPESAAMPSKKQEKPSIAVLPFTNMSGDPEQEYFSDGITEDIITDLSKISGLSVIARNTSFTYKGKAVKAQTVGKELGANFILEGSVRKAGARVRVTGQLVNGNDGTSHLGGTFRSRSHRHLRDPGRNHTCHR